MRFFAPTSFATLDLTCHAAETNDQQRECLIAGAADVVKIGKMGSVRAMKKMRAVCLLGT